MRKPRRRRSRRTGEGGGGGAPPLSLSGGSTLLRLLPLLLLPVAGAAVAVLFSRSPAFSGSGGPRPFPPAAAVVVDKTEAAAPLIWTSTASVEGPMHQKNASTILCNCKEGRVQQQRKKKKKKRRAQEDDVGVGGGPYHDWELLRADMEEMMGTLKIFVYPDAHDAISAAAAASSTFAGVFLPHPDPSNPRLGNYYSEHMFKHALLRSPLLASHPRQAHLFFLPFSINALRNHPGVRSEAAISDFVARYADRVRREFPFWNASGGVDHFYVSCHSVGRDAAARHHELRDNAVHVSCSSSYFQRNYVAHKDVALPQVWPRAPERSLNPPGKRKRLVFFAGRIQNSQVRAELISKWENNSSMDIFSRNLPFPYEEGFRRSRYCLHVKGYEVNSARISDAIHYGCIPVVLSNFYDLPFANVLDWRKFSVIVNHRDIGLLKEILLSIPNDMYLTMYQNLIQVRKHFRWHMTPKLYDSFHMTVYQLWLKRFSYLGFVS